MTEQPGRRPANRQRAVPAPSAAPLDVPPPASPRRPPMQQPAGTTPPVPSPRPAPTGPAPQVDDAPSADADEMQASKQAIPDTTPALPMVRNDGTGGHSISLAALMAGAPDPELDLVPVTMRIPRYVIEALRTTTNLTRRPQQNLVTDALKVTLPKELLDQAYLNLANRPRPDGQANGR